MSAEAAIDPAKAAAALELLRSVDAAGTRAEVSSLTQLEGGWSRHTYMLDVADPDQAAPLELIVRVRPADSVLDTDLGQEFAIYEAIEDEPVPSPRVHGYQPADETAFGGPFFLMDKLPGKAVNVWRQRDRDELTENWEGSRTLAEDFVDRMAAIHLVDPAKLAGAAVARDFRQTVARWRAIYEEVHLVEDPVVEEAYAWLLENEPDPVQPRLVHGDYRIGNCLIDKGRLSGVLDWELASIGDPRFDLGYLSLDYHGGRFVTPGSPLCGAVAERGWMEERYEAATGQPVDRSVVNVFAAMGALMLFSIMGTGLHLYSKGESSDIRAAWSRFVFPGLRADLASLMGW
ncbi:MAG TPA: phosphotransferase family protein [Solirubrobacterales bacterium]|nr:phosphotransferase family protein [Solirubrobacterales bacterium]